VLYCLSSAADTLHAAVEVFVMVLCQQLSTPHFYSSHVNELHQSIFLNYSVETYL